MELVYKENHVVISSNELVINNELILNTSNFIENIENIIKYELYHYNVSDNFIVNMTSQKFYYCNSADYNNESKIFVQRAIGQFTYMGPSNIMMK